MALQANKTSGKAVAQIKAMYFYHHTGGVEPTVINELNSINWFPVLTLRGTVNVGQDAASIEKILVDQFDAPIGITTEPGDFTFEAELPSMNENDLIQLLGSSVVSVQSGVTIDNLQVIGLKLDGRIYNMSVLCKTSTGASILFSNCQVVFSFGQDGKTFVLKCNGQVMAPSNSANEMVYIATEAPMVHVTAIAAGAATASVAVGATTQLSATLTPNNATDKRILWESSDPTKATVDANGKVTGVAIGSATITAYAADNQTLSDACVVTVNAAS